MKFLSALVNQSLQPAKQLAKFRSARTNIAQAETAPFNLPADTADVKETPAQDDSLADSSSPASAVLGDRPSNTNAPESTQFSPEIDNSGRELGVDKQIKVPLSESELPLQKKSLHRKQIPNESEVSMQFDSDVSALYNPAEFINAADIETFDELPLTSVQDGNGQSSEYNNVQSNANKLTNKLPKEELISTNFQSLTDLSNVDRSDTDKTVFTNPEHDNLEFSNSDALQSADGQSPLNNHLQTMQLDEIASAKQQKENRLNKSESPDKTQTIAHSIQAEPVLSIQQCIENNKAEHNKIEKSSFENEPSRRSPHFTAREVAEEIPQVRIGQVNVVIDDRSSKPRSSSVRSTGKPVNSFGLRGL